MSKIWISGGGAGAGSDDCTGTSADVIKGKTAVTSDSDDEPISGTIEERNGITAALSLGVNTPNKAIYARIPYGAYRTGAPDGYPEISVPFSDVAAKTDVTSAKILSGQSACGVAGTATADAVLDPAKLVQGYSGYDDGVKKAGTMPELAGQTKRIANHNNNMTIEVDSGDTRMGILTLPNASGTIGHIDGTTKIQAQLWGLIPSYIAAGKHIGQNEGYGTGQMWGTFTSDANATASDILSGKIAYVNGNKVTGNAVAGKKSASGTSTQTGGFNFRTFDGGSINIPGITIGGLNFTPSFIIIFTNQTNVSRQWITLYDGSSYKVCSFNNNTIRDDAYSSSSGDGSPVTHNILSNQYSGYVNSTGFCAPVRTGTSHNWIAIE